MARSDLTSRQQAFIGEYLIDLNATQAAIRAGYSPKGAPQMGSNLLINHKVKTAIAEAMTGRAKRLGINADWVLQRLVDEAKADLADIVNDDGTIKPISRWPLIWRQGLVAGLDVLDEVRDGVTIGQNTKIKLSDRIRRIEMIGKHADVAAFIDRQEHTGKNGGPIEHDHKTRARIVIVPPKVESPVIVRQLSKRDDGDTS